MAREMARTLNANPRITVVGVAHDGVAGRELVRKVMPDVVTLDVSMPCMDGLTCLQYIMIEQPTPCVIVSALTGESKLETFEAYALGAVDVVLKPGGSTPELRALFRRRLAAKVIRASHADISKLSRIELEDISPVPERRRPKTTSVPRELVVIGASTGGPRTLMDIIPRLPAELGAAVIVVQHMPASFTTSFAQRLDDVSHLVVREADEGEILERDTVYVAPGSHHLTLQPVGAGFKATVRLVEVDDSDIIVPSVNRTLFSALEIFGPTLVGVILTGLGDDGADGMEALYKAGGVTIAESAVSAVINGMPGSVVERGVATQVVPARKIAGALVDLFRRREPGASKGDDDAER